MKRLDSRGGLGQEESCGAGGVASQRGGEDGKDGKELGEGVEARERVGRGTGGTEKEWERPGKGGETEAD